MHPLYPAIKPYQCHELAVDNTHVLYVEETGNPQGIPVIALHSGPGAGGNTYLRRFFDPEHYRIINFDQRGCGRSIPHVELLHNTTQDLLDDIEAIRVYLNLDKVLLFGGGWGALLSLLYAEKFPNNVANLLIHRVFLGRKMDITWFYHHGANLIYPDYWQEFISLAPVEQQNQIFQYYTSSLLGNNELARMAAAKNWALWKARCSSLQPHLSLIEEYVEPRFALGLAMLELHYINHHFFITENQVLNDIASIQHIPTYIIHGRYDMQCPLSGAWELSQALTLANLSIVRDAGHSDHEAGIIDALIGASIQIANQGLNVC